jgi:hypothetical protein
MFIHSVGAQEAAAVPSGNSDAAESSSSVPDLSVYSLFKAASGDYVTWRPDWPLSLPPDLFFAAGAVSVTVELGEGKLEISRPDGRFTAFPVLLPNSESGENALLQGRSEYDSQGRITKLSISGASQGEQDLELLQWDEEDRPLLVRVFAGGYYFAALEYSADSVIETWYDRDGTALSILISSADSVRRIGSIGEGSEGAGEPMEPIYFDYNNEGLISRIRASAGTLSTLYTERGMPRYLEQIPAPPDPADTPAAPAETLSFTYQWDEAGRLVRFSNNASLDCRYEYTLDDKGNWTERRGIVMRPLVQQDDGRLVPERVEIIKRVIRYGE